MKNYIVSSAHSTKIVSAHSPRPPSATENILFVAW